MTNMLNEVEPQSNPVEGSKNNILMRNYQIIIVIVLVVATFTRFWNLGTESFWYDEYILLDITESLDNVVESIQTGRPPLIVALGYMWGQVFGYSEIGVRSLSAILGVASIALLYLIAKQLFNEEVALLAAGLASLSGFLIYYSQDYRYYSLLVLVTLLSYYCFVQAVHRGRAWYFLPYILFSSLAYYTHLFGVFMLLAQGTYFLLFARKYKHLWRYWFISQISILALILPHFGLVFFPIFMDGGASTQLQWIASLVYNSPFIATVKYIVYDETYLRIAPIVLAGIVFVIGILYRVIKQHEHYLQNIKQDWQAIKFLFTEKLNQTALVITWFALIMFTPYVLDLVVGNFFLDRYVIGAAPAFFILLALGLWLLRRSIPLYSSVGALLIVMVFGLQTYYLEPTKEEWGRVFNIIAENETANDVIIYNMGTYQPRVSLRYDHAATIYYDGSLERCPYYEDQLDASEFTAQLATCVGNVDHLWIVMREYRSGDNRVDALSDYLNKAFNAELVNRTTYYGIQLMEYQQPPNE